MTRYSAFLVLFVSGLRAVYLLIRDLLCWPALAHPQSDLEGPETLLWAPTRAKYLYDGDMPGDNLIFTAHVVDFTNHRIIQHAHVEAWHNHPTEAWYSNFDYQFRGEFITNENGTVEIHTKKPMPFEIPGLHTVVNKIRQFFGKTALPMELIAKRPAHIHWRISAPGYHPLYTQTYFESDNWAFELNMMSTAQSKMLHHRRNTTLKVHLVQDPQQSHDWRGEYTFMLQPC